MTVRLNTVSLEDWTRDQPAERWCRVEVLERYEFDRAPRLRVRILEGPEAGRVVAGLSPSNLREDPVVKPVVKPGQKTKSFLLGGVKVRVELPGCRILEMSDWGESGRLEREGFLFVRHGRPLPDGRGFVDYFVAEPHRPQVEPARGV